MNKHLLLLSFISATVMLPPFALAEIYKHVDADGRVTYSNVKTKGAKKLELEPTDTSFGGDSNEPKTKSKPSKTATPASFPKVDAGTQNQRDGARKQVLNSELEEERKALDEAKKAFEAASAQPEFSRGPDGKTFRNNGKFDEKMKPFQADIDAHQRNIQLLEKEIGANN